MTHTLDLGETSLSTSDLTLEITLHTSIEVRFTKSRSVEDVWILKKAVHSDNVWLDQTPELRIYIYIKAIQRPICPLSNVTSSVVDIICTSKLWHDLGLTVFLKSCEYNDQEDEIQISLGVRRIPVRPTLAKRSRIPTWLLNPQEAHPPPTVPAASLSAINVVLGINTYDELYISTPPVLTPNAPYMTPVIDEDGELNILDDLYHKEEGENSQSNSHISDDFTFSEEHDHMTQEFVSLFTNGLKGIIAGPSHQGNYYTTSPKTEPTQYLSQIAPTVFSPGYREAMNQRAQLIPSIAKSITSLLKTTRNPILREQASNLQNLHPKHPKPDQSLRPPPDLTNLRDTIKTSLWRIAQKQLYDPQAALKLHSPQEPADLPQHKRVLLDEDSLLEASADEIGEYSHRKDAMTMSDTYIGTDEEAVAAEEEDSCSLLSFERESAVSPTSSLAQQQEVVSIGLFPGQEPLFSSLLELTSCGDEASLLGEVDDELHCPISFPWMREEKDYLADEIDDMLCD